MVALRPRPVESVTEPGRPRSLATFDFAAEANRAHADVERYASLAVRRAMDCGQLLVEVRGLLPHGQFEPWVRANCKFSLRSARRYMHMARLADELPDIERELAGLSLRQAYALLIERRLSRWRHGAVEVRDMEVELLHHLFNAGGILAAIRAKLGGEGFGRWLSDRGIAAAEAETYILSAEFYARIPDHRKDGVLARGCEFQLPPLPNALRPEEIVVLDDDSDEPEPSDGQEDSNRPRVADLAETANRPRGKRGT